MSDENLLTRVMIADAEADMSDTTRQEQTHLGWTKKDQQQAPQTRRKV